MSTKKLAKQLGLVRQRSGSSAGQGGPPVAAQIFSYLIVIDFESTCWKDKGGRGQEIIEFPAVLLNTSTGEIRSEFHAYVQPQEHPVLSEFCTELTGITQAQVEAGVPLRVCLSQFGRWLRTLRSQEGLEFPGRLQESPAASPSRKLCTFLTWSDWDLGVCLLYECKRKQILRPGVMDSWIDLRSTYRLFYDRKPRGLSGALQDVGIRFSGREHSGLDDSRNTARLAVRMMRDGCVMKITRSLQRAPPPPGGARRGPCGPQEEATPSPARQPRSSEGPPRRGEPSGNAAEKNQSRAEGSAPARRSLISPQTLLAGTTPPPWSSSSVKTFRAALPNPPSPWGNTWPPSVGGSLVSRPLQPLHAAGGPGDEDRQELGEELEDLEELGVELEERCGSSDAAVLEVDDVTMETGGTSEPAWVREEPVQPQAPRVQVSAMGRGAEKVEFGPRPRDASFKVPPPAGRTGTSRLLSTWTGPSVRVRGADTAPPVRTGALDRARRSTLHASAAGPPGKQRSSEEAPLRGGKVTSPLCLCGRRSKRLLVSNGGPNQGRPFFCCAARRQVHQGCTFFQWEAAVARRTWAGPTTISSWPSLCQNPALSGRPHRKSC